MIRGFKKRQHPRTGPLKYISSRAFLPWIFTKAVICYKFVCIQRIWTFTEFDPGEGALCQQNMENFVAYFPCCLRRTRLRVKLEDCRLVIEVALNPDLTSEWFRCCPSESHRSWSLRLLLDEQRINLDESIEYGTHVYARLSLDNGFKSAADSHGIIGNPPAQTRFYDAKMSSVCILLVGYWKPYYQHRPEPRQYSVRVAAIRWRSGTISVECDSSSPNPLFHAKMVCAVDSFGRTVRALAAIRWWTWDHMCEMPQTLDTVPAWCCRFK